MQSLPVSPARRGRKSHLTIVLTDAERTALERALRQTTLPAGRARRARAILLKADGHLVTDIAPLVGLSRRHVYKWLWAFRDDGLQGLRLTTRGWRRLAGCVVLALSLTGCIRVYEHHFLVPTTESLPLEFNVIEPQPDIRCYQPIGQQCVRQL